MKKTKYDKYHNPDRRCTYPFTPDIFGYCWSYANYVDGTKGFQDIEKNCKGCEMWKENELGDPPQTETKPE